MLGLFLSFASGLTAMQWVELVSLVPSFVELAAEAKPVIKKGIEDIQKAVDIINEHKANGLSHTEAVSRTASAMLIDVNPISGTPRWNSTIGAA